MYFLWCIVIVCDVDWGKFCSVLGGGEHVLLVVVCDRCQFVFGVVVVV